MCAGGVRLYDKVIRFVCALVVRTSLFRFRSAGLFVLVKPGQSILPLNRELGRSKFQGHPEREKTGLGRGVNILCSKTQGLELSFFPFSFCIFFFLPLYFSSPFLLAPLGKRGSRWPIMGRASRPRSPSTPGSRGLSGSRPAHRAGVLRMTSSCCIAGQHPLLVGQAMM